LRKKKKDLGGEKKTLTSGECWKVMRTLGGEKFWDCD